MTTITVTIEKGTKLVHRTEMINATVIAVAHVKQNACIQYEDGYVEIQDLEQIEANFIVK